MKSIHSFWATFIFYKFAMCSTSCSILFSWLTIVQVSSTTPVTPLSPSSMPTTISSSTPTVKSSGLPTYLSSPPTALLTNGLSLIPTTGPTRKPSGLPTYSSITSSPTTIPTNSGFLSTTGYLVQSSQTSCSSQTLTSASIYPLGVCTNGYDFLSSLSTGQVAYFNGIKGSVINTIIFLFDNPTCSGKPIEFFESGYDTMCQLSNNYTSNNDDYFDDDAYRTGTNPKASFQKWTYSATPPSFSVAGYTVA